MSTGSGAVDGVSMDDWTRGKDGRSNSSDLFQQLCDEVELLIRGDGHTLIAGRADMTARLIVAQLAHIHGLVPRAWLAAVEETP